MKMFAENQQKITYEPDFLYTSYADALRDVVASLTEEKRECIVKSQGNEKELPILTVDGVDYELHLTRVFYTSRIELVRIS